MCDNQLCASLVQIINKKPVFFQCGRTQLTDGFSLLLCIQVGNKKYHRKLLLKGYFKNHYLCMLLGAANPQAKQEVNC